MKKVIVILLVLVLSLSFTSCKADKINTANAAELPKSGQSEEASSAPAPVTIPQTPVNDKALELAHQGKVTGLNIAIGATLQETIAQMGEPTALDNYEGASYVSYELVDFILDRVIDDTKAEANVTGVILSGGYELYGVKVGMTPEEIEAVLGTPSSADIDTTSETETFRIDYDCGDYQLSFFANDKGSATVSAYLSKKQ